MSNKIISIIALAIIFLFSLSLIANVVMAAPPAPINPPTPVPKNGGGGGSSSSGSSYSTPAFQTYTTPLKSSDGTVIGRLEGKNFNSVMVYASRNATIDNVTYDLSMEGEMSSKPDNCWLDFNFLAPGSSGLPPGMENSIVFGTVNVSKSPSDWGYKGGSPKYTLKVTGYTGAMSSGSDFFLVRQADSEYQIKNVTVDVSGNQLTVTFTAPGDSGLFTLVRPVSVTPTPVPTPTPTGVPTPTATPLPENNMWSFPILIVMFAIGAIVGAAAIFLVNRMK